MSLSEKWVTPKSHLAFLVIVPPTDPRHFWVLMLRPEAFLCRLCFLIFLCFRVNNSGTCLISNEIPNLNSATSPETGGTGFRHVCETVIAPQNAVLVELFVTAFAACFQKAMEV